MWLSGSEPAEVGDGPDGEEGLSDEVFSGDGPESPAVEAELTIVAHDEHFFGTEPAEQWGTLVHGQTGQREVITPETGRWLSFYEGMREAIEQDKPVPVSAGQAYDTIRVIEAALTSSAMGCRIDLQPAAPLVSR